MSFQRWVRKVQITDCYFVNGTDQQIDFEPSGYSFEADGGGSATVLVDASAQFVTWGMQAGDPVFNATDNVIVKIVRVDSQTRLTTTAGSTSWNGPTTASHSTTATISSRTTGSFAARTPPT